MFIYLKPPGYPPNTQANYGQPPATTAHNNYQNPGGYPTPPPSGGTPQPGSGPYPPPGQSPQGQPGQYGGPPNGAPYPPGNAPPQNYPPQQGISKTK